MLILSIAKTKHSILKVVQPDSPFISLGEPFIEPSSIVSWLTISIPEISSQYVSRASLNLVLHNKYK
jgi:hypothetical protein